MLKILYINIVLSSVLLANGIHQLTYSDNNDDFPCFSPDGLKVAFERERYDVGGGIEIYTKNIYESNPAVRITNNPAQDYGACWSPDGIKIVFSSNRNGSGTYGSWTIDINTGIEDYLTYGTFPNWSLMGDFVAFDRGTGTNWNIWKKDMSTGAETQLTYETGQNARPDVSNDGLKIVFEHGQSNPGIWVVSSNGGSITQLPVYGYRPRWSPDGNKICFDAGDLVTGIYIYIYNLSNGQLINTNVEGMHPDWSVQGDKIAFKFNGHIYYMDYPFTQEQSTLGKIKAMYK